MRIKMKQFPADIQRDEKCGFGNRFNFYNQLAAQLLLLY